MGYNEQERRVVTIPQAREMAREGTYADNPLARENNHEPKQFFRARYAIEWRPDPTRPEVSQYAFAYEVS